MKIPFGKNLPTPQKKELLSKLGFNLKRMRRTGQLYHLDLPTSNKIRCEKKIQSIHQARYRIYYNDIQVIFIHTRKVWDDTYVYFNISASAVGEALSEDPNTIINKNTKSSFLLSDRSCLSMCNLM